MGAPWAAQVITVIGSLKRWRSQAEFQIAVADWMLVGGFKHFLFSIIHGIILPIDYIIFFKMVIAPPTRMDFTWISRWEMGISPNHRKSDGDFDHQRFGACSIDDPPIFLGLKTSKTQGFRFRLSLEIHWFSGCRWSRKWRRVSTPWRRGRNQVSLELLNWISR